MGLFADIRARFMGSLRLNSPEEGGRWLGKQLGRLFPPNPSEWPEEKKRLDILDPLDRWALELAPEKSLGRLTPMVEAWAREASKDEVSIASFHVGDDTWVLSAAEALRPRGTAWNGVGLMMLQGAFREAGLLAKARCYDEFKFTVTMKAK